MEQLAKTEAQQLVQNYQSINSLCLTISGAKKCAVIAVKYIIAKEQETIDTIKKNKFDSIKLQAKILETIEKIEYYKLVITKINQL